MSTIVMLYCAETQHVPRGCEEYVVCIFKGSVLGSQKHEEVPAVQRGIAERGDRDRRSHSSLKGHKEC